MSLSNPLQVSAFSVAIFPFLIVAINHKRSTFNVTHCFYILSFPKVKSLSKHCSSTVPWVPLSYTKQVRPGTFRAKLFPLSYAQIVKKMCTAMNNCYLERQTEPFLIHEGFFNIGFLQNGVHFKIIWNYNN